MKKKIIIVALLAIAVVVVVEMKNRKNAGQECSGCSNGTCTIPIPVEPRQPEAEDAKEDIRKPLPKLLDLGAGKCIPCKAMAPILEEMKVTFTGQLEVVFIDVWKNEDAGEEYGIRMIPTQIFFDAEGNELYRHEGFFSRNDMLAKWQELGYAFTGEPQNDEQGISNSEGNH